ncbi:MAG TPA: 30S ribosomal protein S20 [Myxococcota bacterium]|nr:30S ribosomal protein S20 [Myxococcota bacterium]HON26230.1 30S ribosomal protein S20 [Myxococcota bacterium]HOS63000.1 30S ribosomal protein S20 [Myxococcota bacterium]HPC93012.1 30S ribosomal protein S20 [Myxococcota bacterium]HPL26187.1 30S ribosomal protein S20 [Myxococcota bacterium]
MANHKQALKRHRQSVKANARNVHYKSMLRTFVKKALAQADDPDSPDAVAAFRKAESTIMKVASKGAIPRRRASRKVSRLARRMHQSA